MWVQACLYVHTVLKCCLSSSVQFLISKLSSKTFRLSSSHVPVKDIMLSWWHWDPSLVLPGGPSLWSAHLVHSSKEKRTLLLGVTHGAIQKTSAERTWGSEKCPERLAGSEGPDWRRCQGHTAPSQQTLISSQCKMPLLRHTLSRVTICSVCLGLCHNQYVP